MVEQSNGLEELYQNMNSFPKFPIEDAEKLLKAIIQRLTEIEMTLRLRGDHWRANKLQQFTQTYFLKDSNFKVVNEHGTIRFK